MIQGLVFGCFSEGINRAIVLRVDEIIHEARSNMWNWSEYLSDKLVLLVQLFHKSKQ